MGLCSGCRRVTNLFCFNHRKNVCDQCMLTEHPQCVVKAYLKWLENSDFSYDCAVCGTGLDKHPALRLCCLDVFHLECIRTYAEHQTRCPTCGTNLHPSPDNTTPTAKDVREKLKDAGSRRNPHGTASLVPTPSEASLSVSVNGLPYNASPRSPLSAHSVHTPLDSTHPNRQISRKSSQRNVTDSDADKYGRRSDPDGLLTVIRRHCSGRFSSKRIISLILVVLILFGMSTLSFFHANLPGTSPR
ncbi:hypothetical protein DFJ77DRAFT_448956 [Powellomyces hirtus]|nr:hypothetical protein DFJ77DRAFT_448956 [Powellomyces hirtus]